MSNVFWAMSDTEGKGNLSLGSVHNRARFKKFLRENPGTRIRIEPFTPESRKQRGFFEGAVVPLVAYYQDNIDYKDAEHLARVRHWLKTEFNGSFVTIGGKSIKVPKSTKGELNRGLLERIMDWMAEQGYQTEALNPVEYKLWKDTVFPYGGPENYIDYLQETGKLRPKS